MLKRGVILRVAHADAHAADNGVVSFNADIHGVMAVFILYYLADFLGIRSGKLLPAAYSDRKLFAGGDLHAVAGLYLQLCGKLLDKSGDQRLSAFGAAAAQYVRRGVCQLLCGLGIEALLHVEAHLLIAAGAVGLRTLPQAFILAFCSAGKLLRLLLCVRNYSVAVTPARGIKRLKIVLQLLRVCRGLLRALQIAGDLVAVVFIHLCRRLSAGKIQAACQYSKV